MYKNKDITANINATNIDLGSIKVKFYTEDENVASIRITVKNDGKTVDLTRYDMTPKLDVFSSDGSIFLDEELTIINSELGLIQYNIPTNVIKHAGETVAKLFLVNAKKSVHVANFTFTIVDSGVEKAVAKEIDVDIAKRTVMEVIKSNPEMFKGPKGDTGEMGPKGEGIESMAMMNTLYNRLYGTLTPYKVPTELNIDIPFNIEVAQNGEFKFNYDVSVNKNTVTKRYYVDIKTGSNSNPGTESAPFKSINRALRYGDADEIIVKEGVYGWSDGFSGYNQTKPFNIIGVGKVIIGAHRDSQTWTKNINHSNVYQTTATNVTEIVDYINSDEVKFLDLKNSVVEVSNNPGSYYIDGSNVIYVRTHDSRIPDDKILPNMYNDAVKLTDNSKVYFENVKFTNTVRLTATTTNKQFFAKNCTFSIGSGGNALSIEGYDFTILQNCIAKNATMDGFNYHIKNNILPKVIEINCKGFNNGRNGADQNNGSTMHDGGKIIRIGGEYFNNGGPNVIDVNEGTVSVNIGVHAHSSRATKDTVSNSGFKNGNLGKSIMYLVNCIANESDYSVVTAESQNSVTHIENSLLRGVQGEA